jgi:hypothetical protein
MTENYKSSICTEFLCSILQGTVIGAAMVEPAVVAVLVTWGGLDAEGRSEDCSSRNSNLWDQGSLGGRYIYGLVWTDIL